MSNKKTMSKVIRNFIKSLLIPSALCGVSMVAQANDQMREWMFASGKKEIAEIIAYDEPNKVATLRLLDKTQMKVSEQELSTIDRAWVLQWVEQDEELRSVVAKIGGTITQQSGTGKFKIGYTVYHPPTEKSAGMLPMLILFHPGGNGRRSIYPYVEAASTVGVILVSLDWFQNTSIASVSDEKMLEGFELLLPQIEATVPHDTTRLFMGGMSGGASRAYEYSAKVSRPWAGIYAGGGWLGGEEEYHLPFPKMRVAMVNGNKDDPANFWIESDSARLRKSGCVVSVHAFEGVHQIAPSSVQEKALRWLISNESKPL